MKIPGYKILRQDRTKSNNTKNKTSGGGVALYIDADINYNPRPDLSTPNLELFWAEINLPKTEPLLFGSIYRTPDSEAVFFLIISGTF